MWLELGDGCWVSGFGHGSRGSPAADRSMSLPPMTHTGSLVQHAHFRCVYWLVRSSTPIAVAQKLRRAGADCSTGSPSESPPTAGPSAQTRPSLLAIRPSSGPEETTASSLLLGIASALPAIASGFDPRHVLADLEGEPGRRPTTYSRFNSSVLVAGALAGRSVRTPGTPGAGLLTKPAGFHIRHLGAWLTTPWGQHEVVSTTDVGVSGANAHCLFSARRHRHSRSNHCHHWCGWRRSNSKGG
jgi:hypothetical protein